MTDEPSRQSNDPREVDIELAKRQELNVFLGQAGTVLTPFAKIPVLHIADTEVTQKVVEAHRDTDEDLDMHATWGVLKDGQRIHVITLCEWEELDVELTLMWDITEYRGCALLMEIVQTPGFGLKLDDGSTAIENIVMCASPGEDPMLLSAMATAARIGMERDKNKGDQE